MDVVIVGAGRLGSRLVGLARKAKHNVVVIEQDPERCRAVAEAHDAMAIPGDGATRAALEKARAGDAGAVVVTCRGHGVALAVAALARRMKIRRVLAVAHGEEHREVLEEAGVVAVESPEDLAAEKLFWWLGDSPVRDLFRLAGGRLKVFEVPVGEGSAAADKTVANLQEKTGGRAACVRRRDDWLLPLPGTDLKAGDRVTIFAEAGDTERVLKHLEARKVSDRGQ
ncbi:MAG: TrkA family potassium uptake protein [Halobacteria archaeon]